MNLLSTKEITMSSREVASVVGSRHSDICISIQRLITKEVIAGYAAMPYTHEQNRQTYYEYFLNKRDSLIVVAQNCPEFTAAIVDRWQELESKQLPQLPDFNNPAESARAWADQYEQNQIKQQQLELAAPKVAFVDNYVDVGTTKTLRETAKILKYPERKMIALMIEDKVLYRQSGNLLPYQNRQAQGLFEVKTGESGGHAFTQTRVTTKGIEWLAQRYASELL